MIRRSSVESEGSGSADEEVVAPLHGVTGPSRKASLPGLDAALNTSWLRERLQTLFTPAAEIESIELHHVASNPGKSLRLAYRLQLRDRQGAPAVHFMAGLLGRPHETASTVARLQGRARLQPAWGPAFHELPESGLILLGFPNDPKLRGLQVLEPSALSRRLASEGEAVRIETGIVVRYVPGKRLVMRHVLQGRTDGLYTKTVARDRGRIAFETSERLWRLAQSDGETFLVPRPVAYLPESQTLVQEDLHAWEPMQLPPPEGWELWGGRVGRALARMHRSQDSSRLPLPEATVELPPGTIHSELERLSRALDRLLRFAPSLRRSAEEIWECARALPGETPAPPSPIHGAFRPTQILTSEGRLALLDLEGFHLGDPHHDVANMIAYLNKQVIQGDLRQPEVDVGVRAFVAAYAAEVPWPMSQRHLDWYTATHLVAGYANNWASRLEPGAETMLPLLFHAALQHLPEVQGQRGSSEGSPGVDERRSPVVREPQERTLLQRQQCAVDAHRMAALLSTLHGPMGADHGIDKVDVLYAAADPEGDLRAWYRVWSDGGARDLAGFLQGTASSRRRSKRSREADRAGTVRIVPEIDMELWDFPADPRLSGLKRLAQPEYVRSLPVGPLGFHAGRLVQEIVRYVPAKRAVLVYAIDPAGSSRSEVPSGAAVDAPVRQVYCKVYGSRTAATRAAERYRVFWEACRQRPSCLPTPRLLHVDGATASLWFEALPGQALDAAAPEPALVRIGSGLAALHTSDLVFPADWSPEGELEATRRCAASLEHVRPEVAGSLQAICVALAASLPRIDFGPAVPCHGSFKLNHVVWDGRQAGLLDVDGASMGSPWLDVANLMTHVQYLTCDGSLDAARAGRLIGAFRSAYEEAVPWGWSVAALNWCLASLLVRKQAFKCVKHMHPNAGEKVRILLEMARERCAGLPR